MFVTSVSDEPHMMVTKVANPTQVACWSGLPTTWSTA